MTEPALNEKLLCWYDAHARDLPWRTRGRRQNPYLVWLSEIMLQQTTVAAVKDYFIRFVSRWPTVEALAAADREDVMRAWAGLGYYARARNLHACAQVVARDLGGRFPETMDGLLALPGVGPYTAAAIAAIAFDHPVAAVDGNVERVVSRLYAIEVPLPESKPEIRERAQALVPNKRAGDFAQAMMDLGATICTPKSPNCLICPYTEECAGRKLGLADVLPRKAPKKQVPVRKGYAYWVERGDGSVLLRLRPDKGLLGGMMEVPSSEWGAKLPLEHSIVGVSDWKKLPGVVEHTFTHFHLELTVMIAKDDVDLPDDSFRWVAKDALGSEALPTVMKKVVAHALRTSLPIAAQWAPSPQRGE
jgi:A/G-specific adenine glycosylase